ncbi:MAG: TolC family protein [Ekhidna sp.]|nr:TolC family protein [Ekhidna sp.]
MRDTFFIILFVVNAHLLVAQDTLQLSKAEFVEKVTQSSYQQLVADKQAAMAEADFQQSNALFLPTVTASYTAITTNNPLMAFGSKLNQEILTQQDFNPALLNDPDNIENYTTEIMVLQPLLNLDGVYGRNAAQIQKDAFALKAERTREYLELEATKAYMQLQLAYEAVAVLDRAEHTANEAVQMVNDYYDQGLVQKADVLDATVKQGEVTNQLRYARSNVQNTSDQLLTLMGLAAGSTTIRPNEKAPIGYSTQSYPLLLPENRKDLMAMSKSVIGYSNMLSASKMKFVPRINAFGTYQINDGQPFGFGASGYLLGARLSWDLFSGYSNIAKTNKARLEMEKASLEKEEYLLTQQAELNKAIRMLADAESKVLVSQNAFEQATESHKIRRDRFEEGLEKTVDLLFAESQMYQKELQLQQAIFEYNFTKEYLHFLTRE